MANFATHIGVGTVVSGGLATLTLAADVISPESLMAVTMAGVLGSILPDIDLKESRASRAFFSGLAFFFAFCVMMMLAADVSIAEIWILVPVVFLGVRYGLEAVFHRFSYHRGIWHSITAGLLFWFLTTIVFNSILGMHPGVAWLAGGFLFVGYITHLILDEAFSVDLMDRRLKLSFGSAFKLIDGRHRGESAAVICAAVLAFWLAPSSTYFVEGITSQQVWYGIRERLVPTGQWFAFNNRSDVRHGPVRVDPITTGSVPRAPAKPQPDASSSDGTNE
ncbi:MAG: metal-dependent hydrolase [Pseudomonadota bacterium]